MKTSNGLFLFPNDYSIFFPNNHNSFAQISGNKLSNTKKKSEENTFIGTQNIF
jgi:hypothetical protein